MRKWRPEMAAVASDGVVAANLRFEAAMHQVGRQVDDVLMGWRGETGAAASLRALESQLAANHLAAAVLGIADALADAGALAGVCAAVTEIEREAVANGCVVTEEGIVTAPRADTGNPAVDLVLQACFDGKALTMQARLEALLDCAGEVDQRVGARLSTAVAELVRLRAEPQGGGLSAVVVDVIDGRAFLPDDPKALCALWESLSPADRDALFAYDPAMGNRDGIPVVARDFYNRRELERLDAAARAELGRLDALHPESEWVDRPPTTPREWIQVLDWDAARRAARRSMAEYAAVEEQTRPAASPRFLLAVDERGHGAIALGNPDAAGNLATFVPGTGSALDTIGSGVARAQALSNSAAKADRHARTSVVAWYGYDTPPGLEAATLDAFADEAAPALDHFEDGLRATHEGLPAHNTVVGHSYGTMVIAAAAAHGNSLAVDDMIFAGSPGVELNDVTELRMDRLPPDRNGEHVFVTADPADPVPVLGRYVHGPDPADPAFGATVFASSGASLDLPVLRDVPWDPRAHGNYWNSDNPGLATQGEIIAGAYNPK
ncbi:alpha/beta hydrolase [Nocardia sp. NPDC051030]|uniref:alpha/beta hydrolase n=1 Tax=Nocardia sp. NPDC051030 TaxID=3155162 RepID=UPI003423556D